MIFDILDTNGDGWVGFYDYAFFIQTATLFQKFDEYNIGRVLAGNMAWKIRNYYDYPSISYKIRDRSQRFGLIPSEQPVDLFGTLLILKIDDIIASSARRSDKATLYEFELRNVFKQICYDSIPGNVINHSLRDYDSKNIPLYDWECAFINSVKAVLNYNEASYAYLLTRSQNFTLTNTQFMNVYPQLEPEDEFLIRAKNPASNPLNDNNNNNQEN